MKGSVRKFTNTLLFLCYLDHKYLFSGIKLLFLQFCYYVCKATTGQYNAFNLLNNIEIVISLRNIKFSIPAIPGDLGFIFEVFIRKSYELIDSFIPKEGHTCLDIGATVGECALSWHTRNSSGTIICCEPNPYTFKRLQKNISLNECTNIDMLPIAVNSRNAPMEISYDPYCSMAIVGSNKIQSKNIVEGQTLDYLIKERQINKIDICKIDVEGHEVEVIKGTIESLKKIKRLIIECHSESLSQAVKEMINPHFIIVKEIGTRAKVLFAENKDLSIK